MAVFAIKMDASDVNRGAAEAAAAMKDVAKATEQASSSIGKATGTAKQNYEGLSEAAKAAGMFNDSLVGFMPLTDALPHHPKRRLSKPAPSVPILRKPENRSKVWGRKPIPPPSPSTKLPPYPMSLIESSCRSPRLLSLPIRHTSF